MAKALSNVGLPARSAWAGAATGQSGLSAYSDDVNAVPIDRREQAKRRERLGQASSIGPPPSRDSRGSRKAQHHHPVSPNRGGGRAAGTGSDCAKFGRAATGASSG